MSKDGKYRVKLFDGRTNSWEIIEIDDYLPCTPWGGNEPDLLFGKINEGKMYMALLEKAFAKLYGSWSNLARGYQAIAWFHLTGCTEYLCYGANYRGSAPKWLVTAADGIQVVAGRTGADARKRKGKLEKGTQFIEKQRTVLAFSAMMNMGKNRKNIREFPHPGSPLNLSTAIALKEQMQSFSM